MYYEVDFAVVMCNIYQRRGTEEVSCTYLTIVVGFFQTKKFN